MLYFLDQQKYDIWELSVGSVVQARMNAAGADFFAEFKYFSRNLHTISYAPKPISRITYSTTFRMIKEKVPTTDTW